MTIISITVQSRLLGGDWGGHAGAERFGDRVYSLFNSILVASRSNSLPVFLHELVRMPAEDELAVDFFLADACPLMLVVFFLFGNFAF